MTAPAIVRAFAVCSASYGARFSVPSIADEARAMVETWAFILADIPDDLGMAAFAQHCRSCAHPPTPADVRRLCELSGALPSAGEAWAEAIDAARHVGYQDGEVPEMSCPEVAAAARAVGWSAICFAGNEMQLSTTRAHFFRIYDGLSSRQERERQQAEIEGACPAGMLSWVRRVDDAIAAAPVAELPAGTDRDTP